VFSPVIELRENYMLSALFNLKKEAQFTSPLKNWGFTAKILMKKLTVWLLPIVIITMTILIGCVPLSVKISNADRKVELAELIQINKDLIANNKKRADELQNRQNKLYDEAISSYGEVAESTKTSKKVIDFKQRAHYEIAEIHKTRKKLDDAIIHYQAVVDIAPTGYLGSQAAGSISSIRRNRQEVQEQLRIYRNRSLVDTPDSQEVAVQALYKVAEAYVGLGDFEEAIENYEMLVDKFPSHDLASRSLFKIGNLYFYQLYDYTNAGGWGAFVKVAKDYEGTYEAGEAETLLKKSRQTLTMIQQDQDDVSKYTNSKAMAMRRAGRLVTSADLYQMGQRDRVVQDYQNIAAGWIRMRNYPNASFAYRELAENLTGNKFAQADALYQIGRLHQLDGEYTKAIEGYDNLFEEAPQSTWRNEAVYQQAVCFRSIREFAQAREMFMAYMSLDNPDELKYYREAQQLVRQFDLDQDEDGFKFYQEQEAGTSDQDPASKPEK